MLKEISLSHVKLNITLECQEKWEVCSLVAALT